MLYLIGICGFLLGIIGGWLLASRKPQQSIPEAESEVSSKSRAAILSTSQVLNKVLDSVNEVLNVSIEVDDIGLAQESGGNLDTIAGDTTAIQTAVEIMDDWDDGSDRAKVSLEVDNVGLAQESGGNLDTIAGDTTAIQTAAEIIDDWDATQGSAVSADGPQVMAESKDFDGAAFPNTVTEGQAIRPAASTSGVQYTMLVSEDGSQSPYDDTNDLLKMQDQSPVYVHYTDVANLIGSAQNLTASFADLGSEIGCRGYKYCRAFLTLDINNSVNTQIKILGKHTSAGAEEYPYDPNKWTVRDSTLASDGTYRELNTDADDFYIVEIELDNAMPYIQVQVKVGTVGAPTAGQIDAAYYTLGY